MDKEQPDIAPRQDAVDLRSLDLNHRPD
jgi:hypothetical protein